MIHIFLIGVDEFLGADIETVITPQISKICQVSEDEVLVSSMHSMIYHGGVDQTSYHMIMKVELDEEYRQYEKELQEYLLTMSKQFSVHAHVFISFVYGSSYSRIDESYPKFVTMSNSVEMIDEDEEDEYDEVYTGNIFQDFEEKLSKKNNKE